MPYRSAPLCTISCYQPLSRGSFLSCHRTLNRATSHQIARQRTISRYGTLYRAKDVFSFVYASFFCWRGPAPVTAKSVHGASAKLMSTSASIVSGHGGTHSNSALVFDLLTADAFLSAVKITDVGVLLQLPNDRLWTHRESNF